MPRVIRLMAHIETDRPRSAIQHVYLRGAAPVDALPTVEPRVLHGLADECHGRAREALAEAAPAGAEELERITDFIARRSY